MEPKREEEITIPFIGVSKPIRFDIPIKFMEGGIRGTERNELYESIADIILDDYQNHIKTKIFLPDECEM